MKFTKEQLEKGKQAQSVEEFLALARESGITLTEEEAAKYYAGLHNGGELFDDELGNISGGGCDDDFYDWINSVEVSCNPASGKYFCPNCDDGSHELSYYGYDYDDSACYEKYKCESCAKWYKHYTSGEKTGSWFKF